MVSKTAPNKLFGKENIKSEMSDDDEIEYKNEKAKYMKIKVTGS